MFDFTIKSYGILLDALLKGDFFFQTVAGFISEPKERGVLLRHDVDLLPGNALTVARIEHEFDIPATYYFRAVPESWNEGIIREIASLGHEVGYHYENLTTCKGNVEQAFDDFKRNLEKLRELVPVSTICMHGSPRSPWDSRDMWKVYDYRSLGIVCEPYLDVDFEEVFYLTDTGRRWDGDSVSVRDKVKAENSKLKGKEWPSFHSTFDIIEAVEAGRFPDKVMMTVHPQRWMDDLVAWTKELVWQNCKNLVKRIVVRRLG